MEDYNQIPKTGTIGGMVDNITANFQLTKEMLERIQLTKDNARGLFTTAAALNEAYPSPEVGMWAIVGGTSPFDIYICDTAGTWVDSGNDYEGGEIELSEYAKKSTVNELASTVSDEASRLREDEAWLQRVDNEGMANGRQVGVLTTQMAAVEAANAQQDSDIEGIKEDLRNLDNITIEGDVTNNPDNIFLTSEDDKITPKERTTSLSSKGYFVYRPLKTEDVEVPETFAQFLKANYIHEIPFDMNLQGATVNIPTGAVLKFTGGKLTNGTLVLNNTELSGDVKIGADITLSGSIANKRIPMEWFANLDHMATCVNGMTGFNEVHLAEGTHTQTVGFTFNNLESLSIYGHGAIINSTAANVITINGDTSEVDLANAVTIQPVDIGSRSGTVSDGSSFNVGDIVALIDTTDYSFSRWRRVYQQGEFKTIEAISNNTITFSEPVYGYYIHTNTIYMVKRHLTNIGEISGLSIVNTNDSKMYGISVKNAIGATISGIRIKDTQTGISLSNCIAIGVRDCVCVCSKHPHSGTPGGDSYPISIGNSQNVVIDNCICAGGNHGISSGGAALPISLPIVCRFITVSNCNLRTYDNTNASIWFHGNIEYGIVQNCVARQISAAGNHCRIIGNTLISDTTRFANIGVYTELTGYDHIVADNTIIDGSITAFGPLLEPLYAQSTLYTDNVTTCDEVVRITNNVCELKTEGDFVLYGGAPGDTRTNHEDEEIQAYTPTAYARKVRIVGNTIKAKFYDYSSNYAYFSPAAAHNVDIYVADNHFDVPFFRLSDTTQTITFKGNVFHGVNSAAFNTVNGVGDVTFKDNVFDFPTVQRIRIFTPHTNAANDVQIVGMTFLGNIIRVKHISSDNYVVQAWKGVWGKLAFVNNRIEAYDATAGAETAGVYVGANATITTLEIRDNRCFCGAMIADLRHSISGTITNFNYGDDLYLESMWSAATITTKTIYNKVYSAGFSGAVLLNKNGLQIATTT